MAAKEPPKKKRRKQKQASTGRPQFLEGSVQSNLVANGEEFWRDKELWVIQLPKDVRNETVLPTFT